MTYGQLKWTITLRNSESDLCLVMNGDTCNLGMGLVKGTINCTIIHLLPYTKVNMCWKILIEPLGKPIKGKLQDFPIPVLQCISFPTVNIKMGRDREFQLLKIELFQTFAFLVHFLRPSQGFIEFRNHSTLPVKQFRQRYET